MGWLVASSGFSAASLGLLWTGFFMMDRQGFLCFEHSIRFGAFRSRAKIFPICIVFLSPFSSVVVSRYDNGGTFLFSFLQKFIRAAYTVSVLYEGGGILYEGDEWIVEDCSRAFACLRRHWLLPPFVHLQIIQDIKIFESETCNVIQCG